MAASLIPGDAAAGGFYVARFGGEQGQVTSHHVVSLYYNPAGLAFDSGTRVYAEGTLARRSASYERPVDAIDNVVDDGSGGTPNSAIGANAGTATLGNWLASPFVGVASDAGIENLAVAMGVYAPFGGSATWDHANDGVQRWWALEGSMSSMYVSGAAAYRLPDLNLSFGASVSWVHSEINTIRARTLTGSDDLVSPTGSMMEGRSLIDANSNNMALGLGVHWRPTKTLRLAGSYQSQPGFGQMSLKGVLTTKLATSAASESNVEMQQSLPDVYRLGAQFQATPKLSLSTQVAFVRWSVFDRQCVLDRNMPERNCALTADGGVDMEAGAAGVVANFPRDWKNTWTIGAGGNYQATPRVLIMAGGSYDTSAVPDETLDPALMDMNKFTGTAGIQFPLGDTVRMSAQLSRVVYLQRSIAPRHPESAPVGPSRSPDAAGNYSQ
jgi:long-chain fatty acid transport protein